MQEQKLLCIKISRFHDETIICDYLRQNGNEVNLFYPYLIRDKHFRLTTCLDVIST